MTVLQTTLTAVPLTSQHPLKKHMLQLHRLLCLQQHTGPWCIHSYIISNCFMAYIVFPEEIQQPSIDICNVSSSGDVVYKERW